MRSLKAIANINPEGLTTTDPNFVDIIKVEFLDQYTDKQIDLLFEHDILYDDQMSHKQKLRMKAQYKELFESKPVWQIVIRGQNAISKLKGIIGAKDPSQGGIAPEKDTLRSFYGVDRFDNAFYISETVSES